MLLLSLTQINYNSNINVITKQTLFFVNYNYNINLFLTLKEVEIEVEKANVHAKELYKLHKKLRTDVKFLLYYSAFYHNKYDTEAFMLKERNKVYLL